MTWDSRRQERGAGPGPVRTVCDGARQLLLQRTPTEGSYQQSLFREFFFIYNVCLSVCLTGRAGRPCKKIWEILGYGFQNMVFRTWDLNFGAWEISRYDFQDMVFRTWDLNFGAWIFTLAVSKTETWKLFGRDFQDVGSQFWDLDFTQGASQWPLAMGTH